MQFEEPKWVKMIPGIPKALFPLQVQRASATSQQCTRKACSTGKTRTQPCAVWGGGSVTQQNLPGQQSLHPRWKIITTPTICLYTLGPLLHIFLY